MKRNMYYSIFFG